MSVPPRPPGRSDSKYSESRSALSSGLPSREDELMPESGCADENGSVVAARAAIQMSSPPEPPLRFDSNTIVFSSGVSDGAAAFDVGRLSSAIATGGSNTDAGSDRCAWKMSLRVPPLARVEPKYTRRRSGDSHGRVCDSPGMPVASGVIEPPPLSRKTLYWPRPFRSSSDTCHPAHQVPVPVVNPLPLAMAFNQAPLVML